MELMDQIKEDRIKEYVIKKITVTEEEKKEIKSLMKNLIEYGDDVLKDLITNTNKELLQSFKNDTDHLLVRKFDLEIIQLLFTMYTHKVDNMKAASTLMQKVTQELEKYSDF